MRGCETYPQSVRVLAMLLIDFMRAEGLSDAEMADKIGGIGALGVRKLRFRSRGPSIRVAARIHEISGGKVTAPDLEPKKRVPAPLTGAAQEGAHL